MFNTFYTQTVREGIISWTKSSERCGCQKVVVTVVIILSPKAPCSATIVQQRGAADLFWWALGWFWTLTLQLSQQSPSAHCEPSVSLQVVALQHGFVHSCMGDIRP